MAKSKWILGWVHGTAIALALTSCLELEQGFGVDLTAPGGEMGGERGRPVPPPAPQPLCGEESLEQVLPMACASATDNCVGAANCSADEPDPQCIEDSQQRCEQFTRFALAAGACYLPEAFERNSRGSCLSNWRRLQQQCELPTLEDFDISGTLCEEEWTPGDIPEGGACTYAVAGCAVPENSEGSVYRSSCYFDTSIEVGGGVCRVYPILSEGSPCDEQGTTGQCGVGLSCRSHGECGPRLAVGQGCVSDNDCSSYMCHEGMCVDPAEAGCGERDCPALWTCDSDQCQRIARAR